MLVALSLALAPVSLPAAPDPVLDRAGGYCVATGYCTSGPADSGRPAGPMYLAIGLVGAGLAGLRREPQA
jgi:MYXO-CTERM domain-containing protein